MVSLINNVYSEVSLATKIEDKPESYIGALLLIITTINSCNCHYDSRVEGRGNGQKFSI